MHREVMAARQRRRPVESRMYALQVLGLIGSELRPIRVHDVWIERGGMLLAVP